MKARLVSRIQHPGSEIGVVLPSQTGDVDGAPGGVCSAPVEVVDAMQTLKDISSGIAGVVEQAGPSVVRIEAGRRFPGSGIIWAADGTIVTADHVIEQEDDIRVGLPDGQLVAATLAGRDPGTDLAVLRAQASGCWGAGGPSAGRPGTAGGAARGADCCLGGTWKPCRTRWVGVGRRDRRG